MAVNNPLRLAGSELRKMKDSELENLSAQLRLAYAQRLAYGASYRHGHDPDDYPNSANKDIVVGDVYSDQFSYKTWKTNHEHRIMGTFQDTYFRSETTTRVNDDEGGATVPGARYPANYGQDIPDDPGDLTAVTHRTFHYLQYLGYPGTVHLKPDNNVKRTFSYLVSDGGADIRPETSDQNIIDTVFKYTHNQMLNGDGVGTFRVSTSNPGTSTHYDTWGQVQDHFFDDRISSGSHRYDHDDTTIHNNYKLWLNIGSSSGSTTPGPITTLTQTNEPLMYRQYITSMQSGNAILSGGSNIDDYFLEGTYRGTVYIKCTNTNGTPAWSIDNNTYTTLSINTGPEFNTLNNLLGQNSKSTIFYPSGSSSDGYCRVRLNKALEMTGGYVTSNLFGVGLAGGNYIVNRIYKFEYKPNVIQGHFTAPQTTMALGNYQEHDQYRQANVRRIGLLYNVLLPLFENTDPNGNYNFPVYRLDESSVDNGTTIRSRGTITDTRESETAIRSTDEIPATDGTYYKTRYATGAVTSVASKIFSIESKIGVR